MQRSHPEDEPKAPYAFDIKDSKWHTKPSPISAVYMEASDSCKIQVIIFFSFQPADLSRQSGYNRRRFDHFMNLPFCDFIPLEINLCDLL